MPPKALNTLPAAELKQRALGRCLVKLGRITREDYHAGLAAQKTTHAGKRLGEVLVAMGKVSELDVQIALAGQYGFDYVDLADFEVPPEALSAFQASTANAYKIVPVAYDPEARSITVAIRDRDNYRVTDDLKNVLGFKSVKCVVADGAQIDRLLAAHYGGKSMAEAGKRILAEQDSTAIQAAAGRSSASIDLTTLASATSDNKVVELRATSTSSPTRASSACATASTACSSTR